MSGFIVPLPMSDDAYTVPPEILSRLGRGDPKAGRRLLRLLIDGELMRQPINGPTSHPGTVRSAREADEEALLAMLRLDHAENAAHIAPLDEQKIRSFVEAATRESLATIGVLEANGVAVGLVYLVPASWWFATEGYLEERLLYLHPDHRTSRNFGDLLRFARWMADGISAELSYRTFLIGSVVATKDAREKVAAYRRLSNFAGGVYVYPDPAPPSLKECE